MIKRFMDLTLALVLAVITLPLLLTIAILIRLKLGSPVLFKQLRPGLNEKPFYLYKFRTMNNLEDDRGELLPDEQRLTGLGMILRKFSLDELPQLFNVIRGELSFVGPRPLLIQYLDRYSPRQARRHDVKPGITGWAQVNGRNAISWEEKFELDVWYVDNRSFWLDIKVLWLTVLKVLMAEGINQAGDVTMFEFMGNKRQAEDSPDVLPKDGM